MIVYVYSTGNNTESSFVLLWSRERGHREYSMLNCDTGVFYFKEESCPGQRVLTMAKVGSRTWLGTEVEYNIEVESVICQT